jgi:spermidine synthase
VNRLRYPVPPGLLALPSFLSGAAALVYEIVWARRLALVLGSTAGAVAAVLSAFMLGLALGAVLVGRRSDASRRPLRWYGFLEIGIGIFAIAFKNLSGLASELLPALSWGRAFVLLLLPAALMGGTLPVLARAASDAPSRGARALGLLYAWNTLGAVAGALLAVFLLLPRFGLDGATYAAAAVNLLVGALSWWASRVAGDRVPAAPEGAAPPGVVRSAGVPVLAAFFAAGFSGLLLQVAWTRLLVYLLEGFTVAFGVMLATYLLGLGLGAGIGTLFAMSSRNPRRLLAALLAAEGVLAVATLLAAGAMSAPLEEMRRAHAELDRLGFGYAFDLFLGAAAVLLAPALAHGALLPVVGRIAISHPDAIGSDSGKVYAASTLGSVVAPPLAAFLLVPSLGVRGAIVLGAGLLVAAAALAARGLGRNAAIPVAAGALAFAVLAPLGRPGRPTVEISHVLSDPKQPRRLLRFVEGSNFGVSVVEDAGPRTLALYTDDFRAAETGPKYGYMRMLAHLPMLLHERPRRVLVIAFGTGTTAGAAAAHPETEEIVCIELERGVFDVADAFAESNREVLKDRRVRRVVADGREFVGREQERFDVITLEPLMPYTPGAVHLYTREFYESAGRLLRADGLLCQWIPVHAVANEDFKRLLRSAADAFRWSSVWYFEQSALVLAGAEPPRASLERIQARCANTAVFEDLSVALVGDALHLLGAHVTSDLSSLLRGVQPMLDDHTVLEFHPLPRRFGRRSTRFLAENLEFLAKHASSDPPWFREPEGAAAVAAAVRGNVAAIAARAAEARAQLAARPPPPASELADALRADRSARFLRAVYEQRLYRELLEQGLWSNAAELSLVPDRSQAYRRLAEEATGEQRRLYLVLAVRENALLLPPALLGDAEQREAAAKLLDELAEALPAPQARFCRNRARLLRREAAEPGAEEVPAATVPDLKALLGRGDGRGAREAIRTARILGVVEQVEAQAKEFLDAAADKRAAALLLDEADSAHALRAGLALQLSPNEADRAVAAHVLCARSLPSWERLGQDPSPEVRDAAAAAAAERGDDRHLPTLVALCTDAEEVVRQSAFTALLRLRPAARDAGYDPRAPSASSVEALRKLAGP